LPTSARQALVLAPIATPPDQQPAPPRWLVVAAVALLLVATGVWVRVAPSGIQPPVSATAIDGRVAAQQPAPAGAACASVPQVYLETARRADEMVHLFIVNDRSRRLVQP